MRKIILGLFLSTSLVSCGAGDRVTSFPSASSDAVEAITGQYVSAPELGIEDTGVIQTLPPQYPANYVFAHNLNFYSILDGNINIMDVAADTQEFKGMLTAGQMAGFAQSNIRSEIYISETFYSRGTRGERTDTFTVYDMATLDVKDEIVLPGGKRGQFVTQKGALQLIDNDRYALIANFTPASSVSVIDLDARKIVSEIPTPGCITTFPLQGMNFASLCGDGKLASYDFSGGEVSQTESDAFNNIDDDPMFLKSAQIGDKRYFPTFTGNVRPVHVGGPQATPLEAWSLVTDSERKNNWRPSGWQVISSQPDGHLFVLMQKNAKEGSHKAGGSEVWVFDVEAKEKIKSIKLDKGGLSIEATQGPLGHLVVTNLEMALEVYSFDGELIRTMIVNDVATPFVLHAAK